MEGKERDEVYEKGGLYEEEKLKSRIYYIEKQIKIKRKKDIIRTDTAVKKEK